MLKTIAVKGFRSIKDASLELHRLNILIGANGAGKSNFVSFFKLLNEMIAGHLQDFIGRTGRSQSNLYLGPKITPALEAELEFDDGKGDAIGVYSMGLKFAQGDCLMFYSETLEYKSNVGPHERSHTWMPLGAGHLETGIRSKGAEDIELVKVFRQILDGCHVYHFHDTSPTARFRLFSYINDNQYLREDAGNLAAMLYSYRQNSALVYKRIVSTVRKILPEFEDFDLEPGRLNQNEIILNWRKRSHDYLFGPHQLSDGTLRAMALCTLFLQPEADLPDIIILDEPELGLHPGALEIIAGLMRAVSTRSQVIVATQSQTLVDFFEPSEVVTVESHDGHSRFRRLDADELKDWLEDYSIGEL